MKLRAKHIPLVTADLQYPPNLIKVTKNTITLTANYPAYEVNQSLTLTKRKYIRLVRKALKCQQKTTE